MISAAARTERKRAVHRVLVLGAGKIGRSIVKLLAHSGDYEVLAGDVDEWPLARLAHLPGVGTRVVDVEDPAALREAMRGCDSVVSACSFAVNPGIARAALDAGASYFDLTEDVATARAVKQIAQDARPGQIFMPQCGLAPGFIQISGYHLTRSFEKLDEVRLRVGALPQFPTNQLKYNLTWSTDGLINEYCNPCEVIHEGSPREVLPLEGLEHFSLDGVDYEAFNTSGGLGTLWETLCGRVRTLDYKTVRYRGHRDLIAFLTQELRLCMRRSVLKDLLENAVPITLQDVVLIFCTVTGWKDGYLTQVTDARKVYHAEVLGESWSAIQITTAAAVCAVLDLHSTGMLPDCGFVRQEQVSLDTFLANRFGQYYNCSTQHLFSRTVSG
jgi:saccharopine dehydrogenase-like NADP-dependent oxidoreductase